MCVRVRIRQGVRAELVKNKCLNAQSMKNKTAINFYLVGNELPTLESDTMLLAFQCKVESLSIYMQGFFFAGIITRKKNKMREAVTRGEMSCFEVVTQAEMKLFIIQSFREYFAFGIGHAFPSSHEKNCSK